MTDPATPAEVLAEMMDDGARRVLAGRENVYDLALELAGETLHLIGTDREPHSAGRAYQVWAEISDLYDDPRGPATMKACEHVARRVSTEWLSRENRSDPAVQAAVLESFLNRWGAFIDEAAG